MTIHEEMKAQQGRINEIERKIAAAEEEIIERRRLCDEIDRLEVAMCEELEFLQLLQQEARVVA